MELVPPFRTNADLDMGCVKNGELKDDGKILDLSNSGRVVQYVKEKPWGRGRGWGEAWGRKVTVLWGGLG